MILGTSYRQVVREVRVKDTEADLTEGLDVDQIEPLLTVRGLTITRHRAARDWTTLERVYAADSTRALLVGLGREAPYHFGVFGVDREGAYVLDPNSARLRRVSHARDGGRRRDLGSLRLDHYHVVAQASRRRAT